MTKIIVCPNKTMFVFNNRETVKNIRAKFGNFKWMRKFNNNDVMTGCLVEDVNGKVTAIPRSKIEHFFRESNNFEIVV